MATYNWSEYFRASALYNNSLAGLVMRQEGAMTQAERDALSTIIEERINDMPIITNFEIIIPEPVIEPVIEEPLPEEPVIEDPGTTLPTEPDLGDTGSGSPAP